MSTMQAGRQAARTQTGNNGRPSGQEGEGKKKDAVVYLAGQFPERERRRRRGGEARTGAEAGTAAAHTGTPSWSLATNLRDRLRDRRHAGTQGREGKERKGRTRARARARASTNCQVLRGAKRAAAAITRTLTSLPFPSFPLHTLHTHPQRFRTPHHSLMRTSLCAFPLSQFPPISPSHFPTIIQTTSNPSHVILKKPHVKLSGNFTT